MEQIQGIAVFPGVAIGRALVIEQHGVPIAQHPIVRSEVPREIERLDRCLSHLSKSLNQETEFISQKLGSQVAGIFEAHRRMIEDPHLRERITSKIETALCAAESAVHKVLSEYADIFRGSQNTLFAERARDILDIERRILEMLGGERKRNIAAIDQEVIVLANDLTPSETARFNPRYIKAMAMETGGRTSHTAIVAGSLEIPAVVGLGKFLAKVTDGQTVIIDGNSGVLVIDPDEATLLHYEKTAANFLQFTQSLEKLRDLPAVTADGVRIQLYGNIEFPDDVEHCVRRGADGVGLYRSEFIYLQKDEMPTEEDHYEAYAAVVKAMGPDRPVVVRTMDLGGDKLKDYRDAADDPNPFLGLRSIRLSLRDVPMFKIQLRAILRASKFGDVRIMFPLISTLLEIRRCRMIVSEVMEDLRDEGFEIRNDIPIGMMVEVPSAALLTSDFAPHVDFFSIGTNDLIQYALASDRNNQKVANLYSASDPAALNLIKRVIKSAKAQEKEVTVCGEMSGDPIYTMLLLGMGLRRLSIAPHSIPEVKRVVRSVTIDECEKLARKAFRLDTASAITNVLRRSASKLMPELVNDDNS